MRSALVVAVLAAGCNVTIGNGDRTTETRTVGAFDGLSNETQVGVHLVASGNGSSGSEVALTCDSNVLSLVRTDVVDGVLVVDTPRNTTFTTKEGCVLEVAADALRVVGVTGSGSVEADDPIDGVARLHVSGSGSLRLSGVQGDALVVDDTGSGRIDVTGLVADTLDVSVSGSGSVTMAGSATSADVTCTGSGGVDLSGVPLDDATVDVSGSGSVKLDVSGTVTGSLSGSGSLTVSGGADVDVSDSGSGQVVED